MNANSLNIHHLEKIIRITFKQRDYSKLNEAADWYATALRNYFRKDTEVILLGPEFPVVSRVRNEYIKHLIIKTPSEKLYFIKGYIKKILKSFHSIGSYRSVRVIINIDVY